MFMIDQWIYPGGIVFSKYADTGCEPLGASLRQGLKSLKDTQVYPKRYGQQVRDLHMAYIAP